MRGLGGFIGGGRFGFRGQRRGGVERNGAGEFLRMRLGEQAGGGDRKEVRVAGELGAIAEGAASGFNVEMAGLGGAFIAGAEREKVACGREKVWCKSSLEALKRIKGVGPGRSNRRFAGAILEELQ